MNRVAVFVDAGYLFAQGSVLLSGVKLKRGETRLDHSAAVNSLSEFAISVSKAPLLRIYWYDGTSSGPTPQHLTLALLNNVKLRLGIVNSFGEQKGVDSLMVTDMIELARNRAMSDAILLSGDEDLRVGVQQAQEYGVRVHLLGIAPSRGSQSMLLLQEADTTHEWNREQIPFLTCVPRVVSPDLELSTGTLASSIPITGPAEGGDQLTIVGRNIAARIEYAEIAAVIEALESMHQIPQELDRKLLTGGRSALGTNLTIGEKRQVREAFILSLRARLIES